MDDPYKIRNFMKSVVRPDDDKCIDEEMLAYIFATGVVEHNKGTILERLRSLLKKIIKIMVDYYTIFEHEKNKTVYEQAIATILTCKSCRNTGAIKTSFNNILGIIEDGNIREIFFIIDEFIHRGCFIASWLLYCNPVEKIVNDYGLSRDDVLKKYKYVIEVLTGSTNPKYGVQKYSEPFIKEFLGTPYVKYSGKYITVNNKYPWEIPYPPSICNLWNMQEKSYFSHKLLFFLEHQRYSDMPQQQNPFNIEIGDTDGFQSPNICYDTTYEYDRIPHVDDIKMPALSNREKEYMKEFNRDIDYNKLITWKQGCCYYYAKDNTVTYKISSNKNKPRIISYSGHIILDFELLSLLDPDFDKWKGIYLLCIMATMIPYCHHSTHELFSTATYWGIDYDIDKSYYDNFVELIKTHIPTDIIPEKILIDALNSARNATKS